MRLTAVTAAAPPIILLDMDNTLVDWDGEFVRRWMARFPDEPPLGLHQRAFFEMERNFEENQVPAVLSIMAEPGLYESLIPYPGALDAVRGMQQRGWVVRLVTAPHPSCFASCAKEKMIWTERHLGADFCRKVVLTSDKTLVRGDVLVDDKPHQTGDVAEPEWSHLVYRQKYNATAAGGEGQPPQLERWEDWETVISAVLKARGRDVE